MKEYISTIIYICIFSIILELILPDNKMKKYIATLVSLLVILTIISPVFNFLKNEDIKAVISNSIEEISSNTNINMSTNNSYDFASYKDKMVTNSTKGKIEKEILSNLKSNFQKLDITKVTITLDEKYNLQMIDVYLTNLNGVDVASDIICHITKTYNVKDEIINVIKGE